MNQRGKKKNKLKEMRTISETSRNPNIRIKGVPEEHKKKGHEKILEEIIVENFPKMGKEIITQVQETQRVPNRINPKQNIPTHINQINKDQTQRTNIKSSKGKTTNNPQGDSHKETADLSIETLQVRREWQTYLE